MNNPQRDLPHGNLVGIAHDASRFYTTPLANLWRLSPKPGSNFGTDGVPSWWKISSCVGLHWFTIRNVSWNTVICPSNIVGSRINGPTKMLGRFRLLLHEYFLTRHI